MNAVLRIAGEAMHVFNDLIPLLMDTWFVSHLPEASCRGDTPLESAKQPHEICLIAS